MVHGIVYSTAWMNFLKRQNDRDITLPLCYKKRSFFYMYVRRRVNQAKSTEHPNEQISS